MLCALVFCLNACDRPPVADSVDAVSGDAGMGDGGGAADAGLTDEGLSSGDAGADPGDAFVPLALSMNRVLPLSVTDGEGRPLPNVMLAVGVRPDPTVLDEPVAILWRGKPIEPA